MTTPLRRSAGAVSLALALLVAACGSDSATPTPASSAGAPSASPGASASAPASGAPSPGPSADTAGCDPAEAAAPPGTPAPDTGDPNAGLYGQIEQEVIALRGITPTAAVERGVFDKPALCAYITASFEKDNPEALITGTQTIYRALGLMPADASLQDLYVELLTSQVAGLYDDETKKMYVVTTTGEIGPTEKITYAHEYTHALQDQRFGLRKLVGDAKDQGDRTMARTALVEGDATLLMSLWAQQHLTPQELAQVAGSAGDPASEAILAKMPPILKDPLLFPYTAGLQVALGAFQRGGGYGGVDALFANPPATTEQVLHPDKLAAGEAGVNVSFPADLATSLGSGWRVSLEDTLGEFLLEIAVRDGAKAPGSNAAAQGWGGDRLALLEGPAGANAVVLDTAWDTEQDAGEFSDALAGYATRLEQLGRSASVLRPSPGRVVVISAGDADTLGRVANVLGLAG